jgi:hypothetical protein
VNDSFDLFEQTNLTSSASTMILPTGDTVIRTAPTRRRVRVPGSVHDDGVRERRAGIDGNGSFHRTATGGGDILIRTGKLSDRPKNRDVLYAARAQPAARDRPKRPSTSKPPYRPASTATRTRKLNLNGPSARPASRWTRGASETHAIQKNLREFIAVIVMVISAIVGGYILSNQRFYLPAWVRCSAPTSSSFEGGVLTAQSVTRPGPDGPDRGGRGRGDSRRARDGRAVVDACDPPEHADMIKRRHDAPEAEDGLKDM